MEIKNRFIKNIVISNLLRTDIYNRIDELVPTIEYNNFIRAIKNIKVDIKKKGEFSNNDINDYFRQTLEIALRKY